MLKIGKDYHNTFSLTNEFHGETALLDCFNDRKVIRYLGAPIDKGMISRMKWCERLV
jgi:hypothetical protein